MRSGRIGTASDSSAARYLPFHSSQIPFTFAIQAERRAAVPRSHFSTIVERQALASPSSPALSG
jgi:hypothetical protein